MRRFHTFAFDQYYPAPGWGQHKRGFDSLPEAITHAEYIVSLSGYKGYVGCEVVDMETETVVFEAGRKAFCT